MGSLENKIKYNENAEKQMVLLLQAKWSENIRVLLLKSFRVILNALGTEDILEKCPFDRYIISFHSLKSTKQ